MSLTGSLRDFDLSYIFQIVAQESKTGKLVLNSSDKEGYVIFDGGKIVSAGTSDKDIRAVILIYLAAVKGVPAAAVRSLADGCKDDTHQLAAESIRLEYISREELYRLVEISLEDLACGLFVWKQGTYQFNVLPDVTKYCIGTISLSTEAVTMEAARRVDEWERIRPYIGMHSVFVQSGVASQDAPPDSAASPLENPAEYLYSLIDGTTSVEYLCRKTFLSEYRIFEKLFSLLQQERLLPLADHISRAINDALRRDVEGDRAPILEITLSSLMTVTVVLAVFILSNILPTGILRPEHSVRAHLGTALEQDEAQRKVTVFSLYLHAHDGYEPAKLIELVKEGLLAKCDLPAGASSPVSKPNSPAAVSP